MKFQKTIRERFPAAFHCNFSKKPVAGFTDGYGPRTICLHPDGPKGTPWGIYEFAMSDSDETLVRVRLAEPSSQLCADGRVRIPAMRRRVQDGQVHVRRSESCLFEGNARIARILC